MVWYSHLFKNFPKIISTYVGYISFSHLIALVRTSSTVLNRSGESGHSCLGLIFPLRSGQDKGTHQKRYPMSKDRGEATTRW